MADGLRAIVVDHRAFRWRFDGRLVVLPAGRSGPPLYVNWGWADWLEPEGPGPPPQIVTPSFVAAAVRFALGEGWGAGTDRAPMHLEFVEGSFRRSGA